MDPTLAGFLLFIRNGMRISTAVLPDDSPWIQWAYDQALGLVNQSLKLIRSPAPPTAWTIYARAVYNLAGHILIETASDADNAPNVQGSDPPAPYFKNLRQTLDIDGFISGVIQSTNDEGTGNSMVVPEQMEKLTFADLQYMKTPWGRTYMGIAQKYGPNIWGSS